MFLLLLAGLGCTNTAEPPLPVPQTFDRAPLKALTPTQYNNTITHLFGEEVAHVSFSSVELSGFYDNDTTVNTPTASLIDTYQQAAFTISVDLYENHDYYPECEDVTCVKSFLFSAAEIIWRRPLDENEKTEIADFLSTQSDGQPELLLVLGMQYLLQAPEFLYLPEFGTQSQGPRKPLSGYEMANRLAYFLWNGPPDNNLLAAAKNNQLQTREQVAAQAWRMLADDKATHGFLNFNRQWLHLDRIGSNLIDFDKVTVYEEQDAEGFQEVADYLHQVIQPQMRQEQDVFIIEHLLNGTGTLANFLTTREYFTTDELSEFYDIEIPDGIEGFFWQSHIEQFGYTFANQFYPVTAPEQQRAGILTTLGLLHAASTPYSPSPVKRGVFVLEQLLCAAPPPPPDDVPAVAEGSDAEATTNRQRYAQHAANPACAGCHRSIDGIGFTFENYDPLGRYQTRDNGQTIDASGEIVSGDATGVVRDAIHMVEKLSTSQTVHNCVTEHWLQYALARKQWDGQDKQILAHLQDGFWQSGGNIPELLVNIVSSPSFRYIGGE